MLFFYSMPIYYPEEFSLVIGLLAYKGKGEKSKRKVENNPSLASELLGDVRLVRAIQMYLPFFIIATSSLMSVYCGTECQRNSHDPSKVAYTIRVSKSGDGNFSAVQEAINAIPSNNDRWIRIFLDPGTYIERVQIPRDKPCIVLEGQSRSDTIISNNLHKRTNESATFTSFADNFVAKNITFENSYNIIGITSDTSEVKQAIAAEIQGDKSSFYSCGFMGYQDTIWDSEGRHLFHSCYIEGGIDFIWGSGQSVYMDCTINVTIGLKTSVAGFITAQGRASEQETSGFVFIGGSVAGVGKTYLGRAYRPYSRVMFQGSTFSDIIVPQGWDAWQGRGHEGNLSFSEVDCDGPGANTSERVPWEKHLGPSEIKQYTIESFVDQDSWIGNQP